MRHRLVAGVFSAPLLSAITVCIALLAGPASAVTIDWVTVGHAGNACDPQATGCYGAVAYDYQISKYEVTNAQYTEFLNAVADADPNGLFSTNMLSALGGIVRSGSSGSFSYSVKTGFADKPVNFVSFWDALRFANWLGNGQPTGAQDNTTTEGGAYTITAGGIAANSPITRNSGVGIFLTSENEWYKAAYYDAVSTSYFDYPAGSDTQTACTAPTAAANSANCDAPGGNFTDADVDAPTIVGSFSGSSSPYGTFDQGGNVAEWIDANISQFARRLRGGSFIEGAVFTSSFAGADVCNPECDVGDVGFRVVMRVPEPGTGLLLLTGLLGGAALRKRST